MRQELSSAPRRTRAHHSVLTEPPARFSVRVPPSAQLGAMSSRLPSPFTALTASPQAGGHCLPAVIFP